MSKPVDWEAYLDTMSAMIGMTIPADHREATNRKSRVSHRLEDVS